MAAPLFVASEAALKSALRLSAVPASALDTEAIIDEAILRARLRFYRDLGATRTNELVALPYTDQPTTEDQVLRALANTVEVKMVKCQLLRDLPNTFMDASGDVNSRWNEEAPTRERGGFDLEEELSRCENEIVAALVDLAAPNTLDCDEVQVFDGTPDCQTSFPATTPRVGMSLKNPTGTGTNLPADD
jgi:hypothetical protein